MEKNNLSIFLNNSNFSKENYAFNENENEINISKKYLNIELKQEENNTLKNEEKYKIYENSHKKKIFEKNYGQKISLFSQANQSTTSKSKNKGNLLEDKNSDSWLDEHIKELKQKYEDDHIFFECMDEKVNKDYHLFSFCCFCYKLAFAYNDVVTCLNKCFLMKVKTSEFNYEYTLDHLISSHFEYSYYHSECGGEIIPLYINHKTGEPFFICTACDKKILEKNGIIL